MHKQLGLFRTTTVVVISCTKFSLMGYIPLEPAKTIITVKALVIGTVVKVSSFRVTSFVYLVKVFAIDCQVIFVPITKEAISISPIITRESFARIFVTSIQVIVVALE